MAISGTGYDTIPARQAVGPVGGLHGRDQRSSAWQQGIKDARTRADQPIRIRSKTRVTITGGAVSGARAERDAMRHGGTPKNPGGKNARKRAARR